MTREGRLALLALHDLGAVSARYDHAGYRELTTRKFADWTHRAGDPLPVFRLTPAGARRAALIF